MTDTTCTENKYPIEMIQNWVIPALITLFIAAIPFSIGKYYEFNTDDPYDGSLNIYHAHELCIGKKLGVDVFPSARPATLLVNCIGVKLFGYSETGPIYIQTIMQITALGFAFVCIKKLFGNIPAIMSVILGAFYLSCPPYAKFGNVKEQYMIACMIISACAFIFYELKNKRYWLLICGACAINTWYFKPTGFSLAAALVIYLVATTIFQKRKFTKLGTEIAFLAIGGVIGLMPLILFYTWQKQLGSLLSDFPAAPAILISIVYLAIFVIGLAIKHANKHTENINVKLIKRGTIAIVAAFIVTTIAFSFMGQAKQFLMDIPIVGYPVEMVSSAFDFSTSFADKFYGKIFSDSGYVAGSRAVSTFSKQFSEVNKYQHSFVVPIGLGLAAILWSIFGRFIEKTKSDDCSSYSFKPIINQLLIFLSIWWLLDMLFIWISPRSYVQYYLPPNGSMMFLAGYILCRSLKNSVGFIFIAGAWLTTELFTAGFSVKPFSALAITAAIITVIAGIIFIFVNNNKIAKPVLVAVATLSILLANTSNYQTIGTKLEDVNKIKTGNGVWWKNIGNAIKKNSSPEDQIYVWGWFPGIYVAAERSSVVKRPAYSSMHSDSPKAITNNIKRYVKELKDNPPLFIVDSQKMHYPYNDHPLFDLWPTMPLGTTYYFRDPKTKKLKPRDFLKNNEIKAFEDVYDKHVESWCLALTKRHVEAGSVTEKNAKELAEIEVERHKAMEPLRKFIVENYTPHRLRGLEQMVVLKRK